MTAKDAYEIMVHYNQWRRGDSEEMLYTPVAVGLAIDEAIKALEREAEFQQIIKPPTDEDQEED